ncbi:hypothetical protein, partial [Staphylococcus haemolyticus]|uniref:hypothetical protein n=1 Tax=Staphylococcus haemolyticus TaxID=1283 RepID=UPI001C5FA4C5
SAGLILPFNPFLGLDGSVSDLFFAFNNFGVVIESQCETAWIILEFIEYLTVTIGVCHNRMS